MAKQPKGKTPEPAPAAPENPLARQTAELHAGLLKLEAMARALNSATHAMTAGTGRFKTLRSTEFSLNKQARILVDFSKLTFGKDSLLA